MKNLIIIFCLINLGLHAQSSGEFHSTSGTAIRAISQSGRGVHASSLTNYAIYGLAGTMPAVRGESLSGNAIEGHSDSGLGLFGESENSIGVYGVSNGDFGPGVAGYSYEGVGTRGHSQNNYGIQGQSFTMPGVFGYSNFSYGVEGNGTNNHGVHGSSTNSFGVYGTSEGASAIYGYSVAQVGVTGFSSNSYGIVGSSGNSHGVFGATNSGSHFDFYAASTGGNNYGAASSRRWKKNIRNIPDPLKKISFLRGVYYDWDEAHGGAHSIGFIAEEVGEILPEIVVYEENGIDAMGMDYSKMTPLLVEAANAMRREYKEKFADQESKIEIQEEEIKRLAGELNLIRDLLSQLSHEASSN